MIWCQNNKWNKLQVFMVDDGRCVPLVPNHRANTMFEAGRFDTTHFNDIGTLVNCNQDMKDSSGANYFCDNIVFKVPRGEPTPNPSLFGDNPIQFILSWKIPSAEMVSLYGREVAEHKMNPLMQFTILDSQTTIWLSEYMEHFQWPYVTYHLMPNNCNNTAFKALLRAWGWDVWIDWVVFVKLNGCLVLELVSVYSPVLTEISMRRIDGR
jgi:hypothetical protein